MEIWKILSEAIMGKPPKTYPESVADQLGSKLDYLAQNPKGLQVKELVSRMKSRIEAAQASGYTLDDIANVFKAEGVDLTLNTLKQYLRESRALNSDPTPSKLSGSDSKPTKLKNSNSSPSTPSQQLPTTTQTQSGKPPSNVESEDKTQLTNTNEDGFQEMRSDDDL